MAGEPGIFISVDGVDGSGNSTHSRLLSRWISKSLGLRTLLTKEPTDGPIGRLIRRYLRIPEIPGAADALLFAVDRIEHIEKVIRPALARGLVVVTDRYLESSIAYQSAQGLPIEWIVSINRCAMKPSLNIILDIDPERSLSRKRHLLDKFEETGFLERVRSIFLNRAKSESYPIVDTSGPIEETQDKIRSIVSSFLESAKQGALSRQL